MQDISVLSDDPLPLSLVISARVLNFGEERYGTKFIKTLYEAGVLNLANPKTLTKEELIVVKLAQQDVIEEPKTLPELCDLLTEQLRETRLERFVGKVGDKFKKSKVGAVVLEPNVDEDGHWWVDTTAITFNRRSAQFYVHH